MTNAERKRRWRERHLERLPWEDDDGVDGFRAWQRDGEGERERKT